VNEHPALTALADARVVAVLRAPDPDSAVLAVDALVAGGLTGIEITYSTPDAVAVLREVVRRHGDTVVLGAGTVLTPAQAEAAVDAGASYLVTPGTTADLAAAVVGTGAGALLGALTPSEVICAVERGAHAVKLFPGSLGGPAFLRALRGPFPDVPFVPTGGVSPATIPPWFAAGAVAVGAGSELCGGKDLRAGRFGDIERRARDFMAAAGRPDAS
jgi:2-dehydro-3-deoxyphosphogluconate aldolase/(4S)-4-hydroxy-2-oxoglutarate aldolase